MFSGGVGVGTLAFLTASFLNLSLTDFHRSSGSLQWPWMAENGVPTLGQYAINYGILFAVFCWWQQVTSLRPSRIDLPVAMACGFVAWLLPIVPLPWGFMMAATISITVQASVPYMSEEDRKRCKIHVRRYH